MKEFLPVVLGILVGSGAAALRSARLRGLLLPVGALVGGAAASAINGELADERWFLFVSFDALLVWICALASCAIWRGAVHMRRRRERGSPPAPAASE